jgi:predicted dehydrogenase
MQPFPALVVGAGKVGSGYDLDGDQPFALTHAGAFDAHAATALAGGVDPDRGARERFERRWSVPCFQDLDSALEATSPAIVSVATPVESHAEVIDRLVSSAPRAIWCEKPIAPDAASGAAIVEACRRAGIALQMNFLRRFDSLHRRARAMAHRDGAEALHIDVRYSGSLVNYGSHAVDLVRWFGGKVEWVQAVSLETLEPAVFCGGDGFTATFCQVRNDNADVFDTEIFTTTSRITITSVGEQLARAEAEPAPRFAEYRFLGHGTLDAGPRGMIDAMVNGVGSLVTHLAGDGPLLSDGDDGVAALLVQEAAIESARQGAKRVSVPAS